MFALGIFDRCPFPSSRASRRIRQEQFRKNRKVARSLFLLFCLVSSPDLPESSNKYLTCEQLPRNYETPMYVRDTSPNSRLRAFFFFFFLFIPFSSSFERRSKETRLTSSRYQFDSAARFTSRPPNYCSRETVAKLISSAHAIIRTVKTEYTRRTGQAICGHGLARS